MTQFEKDTARERVRNYIEDNISTAFKWAESDVRIIGQLMQYEGTPRMVNEFAKVADKLTDYSYWYILSTIWVSYTGLSDLALWRHLFSSRRPNKAISLMKPDELKELAALPSKVWIYRAKRPGETDWIAYTLSLETACRFAVERKVDEIHQYQVKKRDILALFLRREESEVICLDKTRVKPVRVIQIVKGV